MRIEGDTDGLLTTASSVGDNVGLTVTAFVGDDVGLAVAANVCDVV